MESLTSWTDDIPICRQSGIGAAANEIYRKDGRRAEMHPSFQRFFHFAHADNLSLYGLFDGFGGPGAADFALRRMPAELLLGQLSTGTSDEGVREALRLAFQNVDREYFESRMEDIMTRIVLRQNPNVRHDDPHLRRLEAGAGVGASAAVAVVSGNKLFAAGCGDTRAVLCLQLPSGDIKVVKLSVDHVLGNEDEELRLRQLGLSADDMDRGLAEGGYTRCLGYHKGKGGFRDEERLAAASDEPVLAEPEIHGGVALEPSFQFLLLFSRSVTDCLAKVSSCENGDATRELCRVTIEQFAENTTVTGVAQAVIHKIVRLHAEQFEMQQEEERSASACNIREDMSLLVRKFNAKLASKRKRSSKDHEENVNGGGMTLNAADCTTLKDFSSTFSPEHAMR